MNHPNRPSGPALDVRSVQQPSGVLRTWPLAAVVAAVVGSLGSVAHGQTPVVPSRVNNQVGNRVSSGYVGVQPVTRDMGGRGNALGDGNSLGAQGFSWARGPTMGRVMGSGNALDANSEVGSGGFNSPTLEQGRFTRTFDPARNAATNRGFRGSTNQLLDSEIRGLAGSDLANGTVSASNYNATALRDRFYVAQGFGVADYTPGTTPIGYGAPSSAFGQVETRMSLDRASIGLGMTAFAQSAGEDRYVAASRAENGDPLRYIVSPLRGLQIENMTDPIVRSGLTLYEAARARDDIARGVATAADYEVVRATSQLLSRADMMEDQRVHAQSLADATRVVNARVLPTQYQSIIDSIMKERAGAVAKAAAEGRRTPELPSTSTETLDQLRDSLDALRTPLLGREKAEGDGKEGDAGKGRVGPGASDAGKTAPSTEPPALEGPKGVDPQLEEKREKERGKLLSVTELAETLRHGRTIDQLGPEDKRRVSQLIDEGEAALRAGDYFKAERRFDQARILTPGNPLIEVGMAHAQLGAGLYLSASLTLRNLFNERPELIDAKYDRALLPADDRLTKGLAVMRERIKLGDDVQGYGLMLAYIGHQTGDRALVEEGLRQIQGTPAYDTVRELLSGVWLPPAK